MKNIFLLKSSFLLVGWVFPLFVVGQTPVSLPNPLVRVNVPVNLDFVQDRVTGPIYLTYKDFKDSDKPFVVLRLCTDQPIYLALSKSTLFIPVISQSLTGFGFPSEKVILMKSKDCISKNYGVVTTEVWIVSSKQRMPSYDEKYRPDEVNISRIGEWGGMDYRGGSDYLQSIPKLIDELKKDKSAVGVIFGVYRKNSSDINRKIEKIKRLLKRSGLKETQYVFQIFRWKNYFSYEPLKTPRFYPAIYVIKTGRPVP